LEIEPASREAAQHIFARHVMAALFDPSSDAPQRDLLLVFWVGPA
jgi:hypothetical protein